MFPNKLFNGEKKISSVKTTQKGWGICDFPTYSHHWLQWKPAIIFFSMSCVFLLSQVLPVFVLLGFYLQLINQPSSFLYYMSVNLFFFFLVLLRYILTLCHLNFSVPRLSLDNPLFLFSYAFSIHKTSYIKNNQ